MSDRYGSWQCRGPVKKYRGREGRGPAVFSTTYRKDESCTCKHGDSLTLNVLYSYFTAMGVGAADLLTTMIQEEKVHAERYLEQLTQRMKEAGVRILVNPFALFPIPLLTT